jgi:hypothetical protein
VILLKFLPALAAVALIVGLVRISLLFRARAMRTFAARWGLQYIGPAAFTWRFAWGRRWLTLRKIKPPVPLPFSLAWWPANEIRQVWNVIEGQQSGMPVMIFDSFIEGYHDVYRTFFACKTEQNPFEIDKLRDRVAHSHGWTILYRVPFLLLVPWATSSMSIKRLEYHVGKLRTGSISEPS